MKNKSEELMKNNLVKDLGKYQGVHYHYCKKDGINYIVRESGGFGGFEKPVEVDNEMLEQIETLSEINKLSYIEKIYDSRLSTNNESKVHTVIDSNFIEKMTDYMMENSSFTLSYDEEGKPYLENHENWGDSIVDFLEKEISLETILNSLIAKKMVEKEENDTHQNEMKI